MAKKIALRGLKDLYFAPVTENTETAYRTEASQKIPNIQELTKDDERDEFEEYADDALYDTDNVYKYTNMDMTVLELTPQLQAALSGGTYQEQEGVFVARSTDIAPEIAIGYAAINASGGYRLFRHPVAKVMAIKVDHTTKGDTTESAPYQLSLRVMARKIDNAYVETKDVAAGDSFSFIKEHPALPVVGG